jgi:predicted metal-binding transcription factor (methanogenesis marker protein 9)
MADEHQEYVNKINKAVFVLDRMLQNKELSENEYNKQIIGLASDLAACGEVEESLSLVLRINKEYFVTQMLIDAKEDARYHSDIVKLANRIKETQVEEELVPNMSVGKA